MLARSFGRLITCWAAFKGARSSPPPERRALVTHLSDADLQQLVDTSRDPVVTDGDKYKVVLENERVRVLEYRDSSGQRTSPHYHPDYVLLLLTLSFVPWVPSGVGSRCPAVAAPFATSGRVTLRGGRRNPTSARISATQI